MDQDKPFNAYQQLIEAARTPNSRLTGPEDQQMALQNTSQAQQAGHSPSLLYHHRTPYDTQYFETGLGRVHQQHSHQQQRQEQPPHHQHYPIYPVHDYQPPRRRTERNANLESLSTENPIPLESDTTELEGACAEDAIEIKSDVGLTEHTIEYPEGIENRDDANEPGMGSYTYDSPTAEEEAAMIQSYATPEHGDSEARTSLDDAGPSASNA